MIIAIDPGVTTGFAVWDIAAKALLRVESMTIHRAMRAVEADSGRLILVEDARKRTWFGKTGKEVWQGAGSIKRDCTIWQDFLTDLGANFVMTPPRAAKTKVNADDFKRITGWKDRTNEHSRDAGMLIYGMTDANVQSYLRNIRK